MAEEKFIERLPMLLNLGEVAPVIGWATAYRDTETMAIRLEISLSEEASLQLMDLEEVFDLKAIGFAGIMKRPENPA